MTRLSLKSLYSAAEAIAHVATAEDVEAVGIFVERATGIIHLAVLRWIDGKRHAVCNIEPQVEHHPIGTEAQDLIRQFVSSELLAA